jgi:D-aspartate ligase
MADAASLSSMPGGPNKPGQVIGMSRQPAVRPLPQAGGVLLMGGDCSALGVARNLVPRGVPVVFLPGMNPLATLSRYVHNVPGWPGPESPHALDWLEQFAASGKALGWVLVPAGDSEVRLVTSNHERLSRFYRLSSPPWNVTQYCGDKQLTYARCAELGIGHPRTYRIADIEAARRAELDYPVILKPAMKEGVNALTVAKAWRVDNRQEFLARFADGLRLAGAGGLVVQELIPDDGTNQFSYCAFCVDGEPRLVMAARRTRQRPRKAGTGTFVETLAPQAFEGDAAIFLRSLNYTGLVEIEFMQDPRDGSFRLIDVNPRIWTWHALGLAAGVNFALATWQQATGQIIPPARAAAGYSWLYGLKDVSVAVADIAGGRLRPWTYLRQLFGASAYATLSFADPLPALADVPMSLLRYLRR